MCKLVEDGADPILQLLWRLMDLIGPVIGMLMASSSNATHMVNGRHIRNRQEAAGDLRSILSGAKSNNSGASSSEQSRRSRSRLHHRGTNIGTVLTDTRPAKVARLPAAIPAMAAMRVRGLKTYHLPEQDTI